MSLNPWAKPRDDNERQTLWDRLTKPSKVELRDAEDVISEASRFLEWDNMPYSDHFKKWLYNQSIQPATIADHLTMVGQAARSQAFLEVLNHLRVLRQKANVAKGD